MPETVDLTDLSMSQVREQLGQLVEVSLRMSRVAVMVAREDGVLTVLSPATLSGGIEGVVGQLVDAEWSDAQIEEFLTSLPEIP